MAFCGWSFLNLLQVALISDALAPRLAVGISLSPSSSKMSFPWAARTSMAHPISLQGRAKNSINGSSPIQSPRGARRAAACCPRRGRAGQDRRRVCARWCFCRNRGHLIARRA